MHHLGEALDFTARRLGLSHLRHLHPDVIMGRHRIEELMIEWSFTGSRASMHSSMPLHTAFRTGMHRAMHALSFLRRKHHHASAALERINRSDFLLFMLLTSKKWTCQLKLHLLHLFKELMSNVVYGCSEAGHQAASFCCSGGLSGAGMPSLNSTPFSNS